MTINNWLIPEELKNDYLNFCDSCKTKPIQMQNFRNHRTIKQIIETANFDIGLDYLKQIYNNNRKLFESLITDFKAIDEIGNPSKVFYKFTGIFSPTMIRYIKVAFDIYNKIGKNFDYIIEFGGGYGGQCAVINKLIYGKKYIIIDIENVLVLTNYFLTMAGVKNYNLINSCKFNFYNEILDLLNKNTQKQNKVLFISNYSYSELAIELQDLIFENIIKHCEAGYITYNKTKGSHNIKEIFDKINKNYYCEILPENIRGSRSEILLWH